MNQKEVAKWIDEAKKRGYSQAQIEEELKKQGYNSEKIGKSSDTNLINKKNLIIISAALILLAFAIGSYFVFLKPGVSTESENLQAEATSLFSLNKYDESLKLFQEVLSKYHDNKNTYIANYYIGRIYFAKEEFETAVPYFEKAIELNPNAACDANVRLGMIAFDKGEQDKAFQYFSTALEINKKSNRVFPPRTIERANYYIGRIYLKKGEYDKAIEYLETAYKLELAPKTTRNTFYLGKAYYLNKDYDSAKGYLEEYLKLNPSSETTVEEVKGYLKIIEESKSA